MFDLYFEVSNRDVLVFDGYISDPVDISSLMVPAIESLGPGEYALVLVEDTPEAHELLEKLGKIAEP